MADNKNDLLALIANLFPDNNANEITPQKLRQGLSAMISSDVNMEELTDQYINGAIAALLLKTFDNPQQDPSWKEGLVFWDDTEKALSYYNEESDTKINCGQEVVERVLNQTGATLTNGTVVTVFGASGGVPLVAPSIATSSAAARSVGLVTHDIPDGQTGYVTYIGKVRGLDTSGFLAGEAVYVSDVTPGGLTNESPRISSLVGLVLVSDASEGVIIVGPERVIQEPALAQCSTGLAHTQSLTTTPSPAEGFSDTPFSKNVSVTNTPANGSFRCSYQPIDAPYSGYYDFYFQLTGEATTNDIVVAEIFKNGVATGIIGQYDFSQATIDEGTIIVSGLTEEQFLETDEIEIYVYSTIGSTTFIIKSVLFNCKRLGGE